jgi:hypothetical protein
MFIARLGKYSFAPEERNLPSGNVTYFAPPELPCFRGCQCYKQSVPPGPNATLRAGERLSQDLQTTGFHRCALTATPKPSSR